MANLLLPSVNWVVILCLFSPAISLIAVTLIVRGSAKARSVEESQQSAVFLILPVILFVFGTVGGGFIAEYLDLTGIEHDMYGIGVDFYEECTWKIYL